MTAQHSNLIWIDLEMTGLDSQHDHIIEIATIVTDGELNTIAEGPVIAIHQPDSIMDNVDDWNKKHHTASGLVARVKASKYTTAQAEAETLDFLKQHVVRGKSPMCGNSICQDRRFMARLMPELESYFHYRNLDVSSIKELVNRWYPEHAYQKRGVHLALDDIRDSIDELRHYRQYVFKK